jgi:uroporphyrin-III C-methyltransferase/precorrin-2 dehydrogenase/sirohydrochlorin ferrochelatase
MHRRAWQSDDLSGAAIAVAACEDDGEARRFAAAARTAGVPVNIIDKPKFCDFAFGAIVNRSPLVIGISTDGAAPVFGQAIRAKLEALIPRGFARWAEAAQRWRRELQSGALSFNARRRFWQLFTARALTHPEHAPERADFDRLMAETRGEAAAAELGSVMLVGAGPGDPELLTLRAVRAMQSADIILYDDLVSPGVLEFARREAKKMLVGKTGHGPACAQGDINAMMIGLAKAGRRVVRLKGGDPMIFGRAGEEILACRKAGIAVEIVPGITAAQGAASRLGVSLTHRNEARRVQYVTGHAADGGLPADLDWRSLADPTATTAVYMPVKTLPRLVASAVAGGLDPTTPAVAIARATRPDEAVVAAAIAELPARLETAALPGPVLVLIGRALADVSQGVATGASSDKTFRISS